MPLFSASAKSGSLASTAERPLLLRAEHVLANFARAFPSIKYDIYWETDAVNAQAYMRGHERCVRVYGGLIRHRAIGPEGLALAIAHETGHHEGGEPRDPYYEWMTTDNRADYWAALLGMRQVFPEPEATRQTVIGALQLTNLLITGFDRSEEDAEVRARMILAAYDRLELFLAGAQHKSLIFEEKIDLI